MEGFSETGDYSMSSNLWNLLQKDEGWKGMSKFGQLNWQEEISKAILAASHGYANWNMYKAKEIDKSLTTGDGQQLTYDGKQWKDSNGNIYSGVDYDSSIGQFIYSGMIPAKSQVLLVQMEAVMAQLALGVVFVLIVKLQSIPTLMAEARADNIMLMTQSITFLMKKMDTI